MATKAQIEKALGNHSAAVARGRARHKRGELAASAWYERDRNRVHVELISGSAFAVPVQYLQGLKGAKPDQLERVTVTGRGYGLYWPELDVDVSVPDLIAGSLGTRAWTKAVMQKLGRRGGSRISGAKAAAARENGKRGGRPRKQIPITV
jgi:hypothetical protein